MRTRALLAVSLLPAIAALPSCGDGSSAVIVAPLTPQPLQAVGNSAGAGMGDALAASLQVSTGAAIARATAPAFAMQDGNLAQELRFRTESHLEASAFASGGARLEGSEYVRRLAALPNAPPDANGNGSNLDETLARELAQLAALTGAANPATFPTLFQAERTADYAASVQGVGRTAYGMLGTVANGGTDVLRTEHIGHAILARARAAASLLSQSRGTRPGASADDGMRGLLLLQQAIALEETLLRNGFYDGTTMGRIANPSSYDPTTEPAKWLPAEFRTTDETAIPGAPKSYLPYDPDAELSTLAIVLRAASELAWMGSLRNPNPSLRDTLNGNPFGPTPGTQRPRTTIGTPPVVLPATAAAPPPPSWEDDIRPLFHGAVLGCVSCHGDRSLGVFADYSLLDYTEVFVPGQSGLQPIVPGDHQASLLWQVAAGQMIPVTAPSVQPTRMPEKGFPRWMTPGEVSLIADWIDAGAPERAPPSTVVPAVGQDLAIVLLRNLAALHVDPTTGGLSDRHDGTAPSGHATARSTGEALLALVAYADAFPQDALAVTVLGQVADHALAALTDASGTVHASVVIASSAAAGPADLFGHASMTAGLFAAGRALGRADLTTRATELARSLLDDFFVSSKGLFRSDLTEAGIAYTPESLAAVLEALREATAGGVSGASDAHDTFLRSLGPVLVYAEWDGRGEVLGDGIADTDGNGIPEPALAGGTHGRAPVFTALIREGAEPAANGPVTWSQHMLPLFRNACAVCHMFGAQRGAYRMDTIGLLSTPGESGGQLPMIVPGDPEGSFFYRKLADRTPAIGEQMPLQQPPLGPAGLALVRQWIEGGAQLR